MLTIVPIVSTFLVDVVQVGDGANILSEHVRCYGLLATILSLLQRVDVAPERMDHFIGLVDEYGELFIRLYDRAKAKFHHMYHLHEAVLRFKRVLSCFVTERRHRVTKKAALYTFKDMEVVVLRDLVNRQCEEFASESASLFQPQSLTNPKTYQVADFEIQIATNATLFIGAIKPGDVLFLRTHPPVVGHVDRFFKLDSEIAVRLETFRCDGGDSRIWATDDATLAIYPVSLVVDVVA